MMKSNFIVCERGFNEGVSEDLKECELKEWLGTKVSANGGNWYIVPGLFDDCFVGLLTVANLEISVVGSANVLGANGDNSSTSC